nr:hypothetical protein [Tanacetum cinerariifolium]
GGYQRPTTARHCHHHAPRGRHERAAGRIGHGISHEVHAGYGFPGAHVARRTGRAEHGHGARISVERLYGMRIRCRATAGLRSECERIAGTQAG